MQVLSKSHKRWEWKTQSLMITVSRWFRRL
uniref:Uncharacterized protein n=1 Tax=Rhizophora mucronata TaxID=61149 RepID=A0A2P2PR00_RHIMU